jgi:hypothetical protein
MASASSSDKPYPPDVGNTPSLDENEPELAVSCLMRAAVTAEGGPPPLCGEPGRFWSCDAARGIGLGMAMGGGIGFGVVIDEARPEPLLPPAPPPPPPPLATAAPDTPELAPGLSGVSRAG